MQKLAMAALMLAPLTLLTATSAVAQGGGGGGGGNDKTPMQIIEEGRKNDRAEVEKQYDRSRQHEKGLSTTTTGKRDPWAGARGDDVGKTPAKDAKKDATKDAKMEPGKDAKKEANKDAKKKPGPPMQLR